MAGVCLVGQNGERGRTRDAQVPDNQTTARTSTSKRVTRYVTELAVLLGLVDTRAVKTRTPKIKATDGGARDALEGLDTFQTATFRSVVELIGYLRAYEARLDASSPSGQVPGVPQRTGVTPSRAGRA